MAPALQKNDIQVHDRDISGIRNFTPKINGRDISNEVTKKQLRQSAKNKNMDD